MFCLLWGIIISFLIKFAIRKKSTYALLTFIALIYMYGFIFLIEFPEEKIHLVEYGFLAVLIYRALDIDFEDLFSYFMAFVLTALLGWGDEGIQYILPNRYYQTQDVILNLISGGLGLFLMFVIRRDMSSKHKKSY
jgi:VanZ family protein